MSTTRDSGESVGIEVTETAAKKARSLLDEEGLEAEDAGLRLMAKEKGCDCGDIAYGIEFAEGADERDTVLEEHGLTVVIDPQSQEYIEDLQLDYVNDFRGEGFTLQRTAQHTEHEGHGGGCGCGGHHH